MDRLQLNKILNRETKAKIFKDFLIEFEEKKHDLSIKRGIYLYGEPGTGKSFFLMSCLKEMGYEIIFYDGGDIRNKTVLEEMKKENMSNRSVLSLLQKRPRKIAIVMDEIDGMNNGDKGGINGLIKMVRPKKTKKQKNEETTMNPIICVGSCSSDKKLRELIKACLAIELTPPKISEMQQIINELFVGHAFSNVMIRKIIDYCQRDLRKLQTLFQLYTTNPQSISVTLLEQILEKKNYNDDAKYIVSMLLKKYISFDQHTLLMNDTDRTCVGLLWHENIIDCLENKDKDKDKDKKETQTTKMFSISFYIQQLENICFADFMDRATFQNQIWHLNEMSSLIKTMKNHRMYHEEIKKQKKQKELKEQILGTDSSASALVPSCCPSFSAPATNDLRFTKVLTKYTTEHNNSIFLQKLCQQLGCMDKKDLFGFFMLYEENTMHALLTENYDISKLDISRMYRYLEKYK
jgi:SpoVK/Ycf46/Vps4 family AAA+-type ATPase